MSVKGILTEQFPTAEAIGAATAEALAQVSSDIAVIDTNVDNLTTAVQTVDSIVDTINTNVNTANTNINAVKTNTAVNNTASSTGSLSQKLSYLINKVEALESSSSSSSSVVKSVQRGVISFSKATATATISAVDVNKAIVVHGGSSYNDNYNYVDANISGLWDARLTLTNSTTVTATVGYYRSGYTGPTTWQVIEFY